MPQQNHFLMYVIVFLVVFVPYLFLAFFLNKPEKRSIDFKLCNIPPLYRMTWALIGYFTESIGSFSEDLQPARKQKFQNALIVANIKMDTTYIFAAEVLFGLIFGVLGVLFTMMITMNGFGLLFAALIFGFVGFIMPSTTIMSAADKRQNEIMKALPFSIDLIGSAMRSGIDFTAAIRYYVATEKPDNPLALEFGILLRQLELGKTRIEALEDMNKRVQHDAFSAFTSAVIHGMEVGASIVETMKIQAEEMRRVRFNAAERKAARAVSAMIFPIAVFIMPAMFIIIGTPVLLKVISSGLGGLFE